METAETFFKRVLSLELSHFQEKKQDADKGEQNCSKCSIPLTLPFFFFIFISYVIHEQQKDLCLSEVSQQVRSVEEMKSVHMYISLTTTYWWGNACLTVINVLAMPFSILVFWEQLMTLFWYLGVKNTCDRISLYLYWPCLKKTLKPLPKPFTHSDSQGNQISHLN